MIKLIYGLPGFGKTEYIMNALSDDARQGKKAILIVPEQMTVAVERDVLLRLPPNAQLNIEVLNFSRLANRVFRQHGGLEYNYASPGTKKLIMWRAVKTAFPFLKEYGNSARDDRSLADSMLSTLKEFQAAGISAAEIEHVGETLKDSTLSRKLKDISAVFAIYESLLGEKYSDNHTDLSRLCEILDRVNYFKDTSVYIDAFSSFTGQEHSVIGYILKQARDVFITFSLTKPTEKSIDTVTLSNCSTKIRRDIAALGLRSEDVILKENHRAQNDELVRVCESFWQLGQINFDEIESSGRGNVELWRGSDVYDECESVASRARELIESGYRMGDIVIIARNADDYRGIIEPALDNMNLSYFFSEKTDVSRCPVSRLILSAIRVAVYGWRRQDVIANLKTGLYPFSPRDCDVFQSYVSKWNISGKRFTTPEPWNMNPDGYTTTLTTRGKAVLKTANALKDAFIPILMNYISDLRNASSYRELCIATYNYLDGLKVSSTLIDLSAKYLSFGQIKDAQESARMYDAVLDALDCVCDAFEGDSSPNLQTFGIALKTVLEESELGTIPTSGDQIVIGSANMLRAGGAKCIIIIGACDGEFPAATQSIGLFSDSEREQLISSSLPLGGDRNERAADELFYFRRAVSSPTDRLIVFTNSEHEPSIAFTRFKSLFPYIKVNETSADLTRKIRTYKSAAEYIPLLENTAQGEALKRLLAQKDSLDFRFFDSESFPMSAEQDRISPTTAQAILGSRLSMSQSKLEVFMGCKFLYACKYYLKLDEGKSAQFAYDSIGTFIHYIIEKFLLHIFLHEGGAVPTGEAFDAILDSIISDYIENTLPYEDGKQSPRLLHLTSRLKQISKLVILDIFDELHDSDFKPTFFELPIGTKDIPPIDIVLKDGSMLSLSGVVDRVDTFTKDGLTYIRVVDYKTGTKTFSLSDIEKGLNLQLLLYIFALTNNKNNDFLLSLGGIPTAASIAYLSAVPTKVPALTLDSTKHTENTVREEIKRTGLILDEPQIIDAISHSGTPRYLMKSPKKNSFISRESFNTIYQQISSILKEIGDEMIDGDAGAVPSEGSGKCKYCAYASICRAAKKSK